MSSTNKILIVLCAIVAFVIGVVLNTSRINNQINHDIDAQALLSAELMVTQQPEVIGKVSDSLGQLTLINFWASWCAPCKEEMPIFETMYRQFNGINNDQFVVIGIAVDNQDKAQPLLDSMDISYPILYAERTGMELMESTGNPQGLMPYSLLVDQHGNVLDQILGKINEQQIASWIAQYMPTPN